MAINKSQSGLPALTSFLSKLKQFKVKAIREQAGVTLIEMVVVVAIVALVSTVILFNYSDFSTNVSVRSLAQDVALSVRKAQTYATSVRNVDGTNGNSALYPAYGIAFAVDHSPSQTVAYNKQFVLFADIPSGGSTNGDGAYTTTSGTCGVPSFGDECAEVFGITTADKVMKLCVDNSSGVDECFTDKEVDMVFRRPSPDANICVVESGTCRPKKYSYVKIFLQSAKGVQRIITVWNTGQISVD